MTRRNRPVDLTDAPEHRSIPLDRVEIRDIEDDDTEVILEGYASTFEEYEMYGGPANYGWIERLSPDAFAKTLREKPDLHLLINHAGMPLARTKSGTLDLSADEHGLKVVARMDKRDPEVQSLAIKMARGDMDEMSFAFRVKAQEWRAAPGYEEIDDQSYRTITEVSLHKGDVSVVNWGANPTTSAEILSAPDLLRAFVDCDLTEARADQDLVKLVKAKIDEIVKPDEVRTEIHVENVIVNESVTAPSDVSETDTERDELTPESLSALIEEINTAGLLDTLRELILGETEAVVEEAVEVETDVVEEVEDVVTGRSLADALAEQGITPDGPLSLNAALALS